MKKFRFGFLAIAIAGVSISLQANAGGSITPCQQAIARLLVHQSASLRVITELVANKDRAPGLDLESLALEGERLAGLVSSECSPSQSD